jgi:hypothetical protein
MSKYLQNLCRNFGDRICRHVNMTSLKCVHFMYRTNTHTKIIECELQYNVHCVKFIKLMFILVFDTTLYGKWRIDKAIHVLPVTHNTATHIYSYTAVIIQASIVWKLNLFHETCTSHCVGMLIQLMIVFCIPIFPLATLIHSGIKHTQPWKC